MHSEIRINAPKAHGGGEPVIIPPGAESEDIMEAARAFARQRYDQEGGDRDAAMTSIAAALKRRPELRERFAPVALVFLFEQLLHDCARRERGRLARAAQRPNGGWMPPAGMGAGLAAKAANRGTLYDYQFPCLGKRLGSATLAELTGALGQVKARHETDGKLVKLGEAVRHRMTAAKADKNAVVESVVPAEDLAKLFRRFGVVS